MEIPLPDIIDRISILKLKIEKIDKEHFKEEFEEYKKALEEFENKGVKIKQEWINDLYKVNKEMWDNITLLKKAREDSLSLEEMGRIEIQQMITNKKRIAIKNAIVKETKSGFRDIKIN